MNEYITSNGSNRTAAQRISEWREQGVSLSAGSVALEQARAWPQTYGEGHIHSFCQVHSAIALTLTPGEQILWTTYFDEDERTYIDPEAEKGAVIVFEYAMGMGSAYPQSQGYFTLGIDGEDMISFSMKKHAALFEHDNGVRLYFDIKQKKTVPNPGESFSLDSFVQQESVFVNGNAYLYIPRHVLNGRDRLTLSVTAHNHEPHSRRWFRLGFCYFPLSGDITDGIQTVISGSRRPTLDGQPIYFGDIHVHTAQSEFLNQDGCGRDTVVHNLRHARDISLLDFCAITDHDWQMLAHDWKYLRDCNDAFHEDGRFVTLHAFEWTSSSYGHRNVYLRGDQEIPDDLDPFNYQTLPVEPIKYGVRKPTDPNPRDLWAWLEAHDLKAMTIPHHPNTEQFVMDFHHFFNEAYDRCVEVYSCWGCFFDTKSPLNVANERLQEYNYDRYAGKLHFGFLASSDGHDGNAGEANITQAMHHQAHYAGSGRVAVITDSLTRNHVYDAIHDRHCYAVTGEPILLRFSIGDAIMGDVIRETRKELPLCIRVKGTAPIRTIIIYKDAERFQTYELNEEDVTLSLLLDGGEPGSYRVEVRQEDGEYAWSSPILYLPDEA